MLLFYIIYTIQIKYKASLEDFHVRGDMTVEVAVSLLSRNASHEGIILLYRVYILSIRKRDHLEDDVISLTEPLLEITIADS